MGRSATHIALIDDITNKRPNDSRKVNNLAIYASLAAARFPNASRSIVAITDTANETRFRKLHEIFDGGEFGTYRLLPLQTIAAWISDEAVDPVTKSFKEWAGSL